VIFFDEIDALGQSRGDNSKGGGDQSSSGSGDNSSRRLLAELLIQLTKNSHDNTDESSGSGSDDEEDEEGISQTINRTEPEFSGNGRGDCEEERHSNYQGEPDDFDGSSCREQRNIGVDHTNALHPASPVSTITNSKHQAQPECDSKQRDDRECSSTVAQCASPSPSVASSECSQQRDRRPRPRVIVVAATNRPEDCDPALLRRFAIRVLVDLPSRRDRKRIVSRLISDVDHSISPSQLEEIAVETEGWSGSDLESLTREAVMAPIRECLRAAAILKTKARRMQQRGGAESAQENEKSTSNDIDEAARESLLSSFRNLRPVSLGDFERAVAFWMGHGQQAGGCHFGQQSQQVHYDSDTSSDD